MATIVYKGVTTKRLYEFMLTALPATLGGNVGTYNGETVILVNNDGTIRRGDKGQPALSDPYSVGYAPSDWEKQ